MHDFSDAVPVSVSSRLTPASARFHHTKHSSSSSFTRPVTALVAMVLVAVGNLAVAAGAAGPHKHDGHSHSNVFPPQRGNISNVVWLDAAGHDKSAQTRADSSTGESLVAAEASNRFTSNAQVAPALGQRFVAVGSTVQYQKGAAARTIKHAYFSHSKNATIEVTTDGSSITRVEAIEAVDYQPPLAFAEVRDAIALARTALQQARYNLAENLPGYAILAFPPNSLKPFYVNRIAYVSFHVHEDAQPEFTALVDLTEQRVVSIREG